MLVAKYYCEPFDADATLLHDAIECGRQFRRSLMLLENATRDQLRALEDESEFVKMRRIRVARWHGYVEALTSSDAQRLEIAKHALSRARSDLKVAIDARRACPDFAVRKDGIYANKKEENKQLRELFRAVLSEGTCDYLIDGHAKSVQMTDSWKRLRVDSERGEGAICVRLRDTHAVDEPWGKLAHLGSELVDSGRPPRANHRAAKKFQVLTLKHGDETLRFRVLVHRRLPAGKLGYIRIHQEKVGLRYQCSAQFVINDRREPSEEESNEQHTDDKRARITGVDLGWHLIPGGLRIAYAVGSDGVAHELVLPDNLRRQMRDDDGHITQRGLCGPFARFERTSDLRSISDKHFDEMVSRIIELRDHPATPAWFREDTMHASKWERPAKLVWLASKWRGNTWPEGEATRRRLDNPDDRECYLAKSRHLAEYCANNNDRMRNQVRELQTQFAVKLAKRYQTIACEQIAYSSIIAGNPQSDVSKLARKRISVAAPFRVLELLKRFAKKYACKFVRVPAYYTSQTCVRCKKALIGGKSLTLWCQHCGEFVDRDLNAAANICLLGIKHCEQLEVMPASTAQKRQRPNRRKKAALENAVTNASAA